MSDQMLALCAVMCGAVATISIVLLIVKSQADRMRSRDLRGQSPGDQHDSPPEGLTGSFVLKHCWPAIHGTGMKLLPFMTWGHRARLTQSIRRAGMHGWSCEDLFSAQLLLALTIMFVLTILMRALTQYSLFSFYSIAVIVTVGSIAGIWPVLWMRTRRKKRLVQIGRGLPFFLDMVALGLDSGLNLQTGIQLALDHLEPGPLKEEWAQTLFDIRSGHSRAEALRQMSRRVELQAIRQLVIALIQGESMGLSLSRTVGEYARQQRQARLLHAEKLALQAPIKMLFPLAFCIFPCTFIVLGFPVAAQLLGLE